MSASTYLHIVSFRESLIDDLIKGQYATVVIVNESQIEILEERQQDFVWRVEQRNKTYLKFDVGENVE